MEGCGVRQSPKIAGAASPFGSGDLKNPSLPPGCQGPSKSGSCEWQQSQLQRMLPLIRVVRQWSDSLQKKNERIGVDPLELAAVRCEAPCDPLMMRRTVRALPLLHLLLLLDVALLQLLGLPLVLLLRQLSLLLAGIALGQALVLLLLLLL